MVWWVFCSDRADGQVRDQFVLICVLQVILSSSWLALINSIFLCAAVNFDFFSFSDYEVMPMRQGDGGECHMPCFPILLGQWINTEYCFALASRIHMDVFNLWCLRTCFHMWIFYVVFWWNWDGNYRYLHFTCNWSFLGHMIWFLVLVWLQVLEFSCFLGSLWLTCFLGSHKTRFAIRQVWLQIIEIFMVHSLILEDIREVYSCPDISHRVWTSIIVRLVFKVHDWHHFTSK